MHMQSVLFVNNQNTVVRDVTSVVLAPLAAPQCRCLVPLTSFSK